MAEQLHVGTADLPHGHGWEKYFRRLSFLETSVLTRSPAKPSVLAKWRAAAPGPGAFALVAPAMVKNAEGATSIERGLAPFLEAARVLEAGVVVFRTPPSFSPSAANRELLRKFFAETVPAEATAATRVWEPAGLWELRTAVKMAQECGVVLGCDPLVRDPTRDPPELYMTLGIEEAYFRVTGLGRGSRRLSNAQLEELQLVAEAYQRLWMVFATVDSIADATRFTTMVANAPISDEDTADEDGDDDDALDGDDEGDGEDGDDDAEDGDDGELDDEDEPA